MPKRYVCMAEESSFGLAGAEPNRAHPYPSLLYVHNQIALCHCLMPCTAIIGLLQQSILTATPPRAPTKSTMDPQPRSISCMLAG